MSSQRIAVDAATALSCLGQTVLMELVWDEDPESLWGCFHIVGVVMPVEGIYDHGHFLVLSAVSPEPFPTEVFWSNIRSMTTLQQRPLEGIDLASLRSVA
ncbi:hypothetical protein [Pseudomonas sp. LFM046]|uniref:hypothetical protein n=1 Tax=Pseudomonas sp. LFM046 TaxID=1608357 RepID=UPI0005CFED8C|nr:hypothetical protein [Pseudomonas sp. LFM046]